MTKNEAIALLEQGTELTEAQKAEIAAVLRRAEVYDDDDEEEWNSSGCSEYDWNSSSSC